MKQVAVRQMKEDTLGRARCTRQSRLATIGGWQLSDADCSSQVDSESESVRAFVLMALQPPPTQCAVE